MVLFFCAYAYLIVRRARSVKHRQPSNRSVWKQVRINIFNLGLLFDRIQGRIQDFAKEGACIVLRLKFLLIHKVSQSLHAISEGNNREPDLFFTNHYFMQISRPRFTYLLAPKC